MNDKKWDEIVDANRDVGRKLDLGKPMTGLMVRDFAKALASVSDITTFGAQKYSPGNWKLVSSGKERYGDALYRHLLAHESGEDFDPESNMLHLAHAAWNVLALLEMELNDRR